MSGKAKGQGTSRASSSSATFWGLALLWLAVLCSLAAYVVVDLHLGERPGFLDDASNGAVGDGTRSGAERAGPVRLAGSGSNLPLTRRLVAAHRGSHARSALVVHGSIGSTGGIRAVLDGVVDLGMVSRPLTESEQELGLTVLAYARVPVVIAAHPSVPDDELSAAELLQIYRGERRTWSDGSRLALLLREKGDSGHLAMSEGTRGFAEASEVAYQRRLGRVLYSDLDMQLALLDTEGAVGLFDLGAVLTQNLPIKVLRLDGVEPSVGAVESSEYRIHKDLSFVLASPARRDIEALLDFVFSAEGRALVLAAGYLPLSRGEP